jgi:hypothetical protein
LKGREKWEKREGREGRITWRVCACVSASVRVRWGWRFRHAWARDMDSARDSRAVCAEGERVLGRAGANPWDPVGE